MNVSVSPVTTMTRKEKKEATRRELKRAAIACFEEFGFAETQIGQITAEASVAKGTFYVHFKDKLELIDELLREFNEGFVARLLPHLGKLQATRLPELVEAVADEFLTYWHENRTVIAVISQRAIAGMAPNEIRDGMNPQMLGWLKLGMQQLGFSVKPGEAELVAQGLLSMWLRIGLQFVFNDTIDRDTARDVLVRMTVGAIDRVFSL
ncbi:MAG: TetR/AcrR family transcriptional regulator [Myxococcales bacterium]|nr:TetR/AcrR family transcriptional regulator [Myxococcales bacterium]